MHYSWHWAFGMLGVVGLAWTVAWMALGREGPLAAATGTREAATQQRVAYRRLLLSPTIIACWCASIRRPMGIVVGASWQGTFLIKD